MPKSKSTEKRNRKPFLSEETKRQLGDIRAWRLKAQTEAIAESGVDEKYIDMKALERDLTDSAIVAELVAAAWNQKKPDGEPLGTEPELPADPKAGQT